MALSICEPCCKPSAWVGYIRSWRQAILTVLCSILEQLAAGISVSVEPAASTATLSAVNDSNADQTLLPANLNRKGMNLYNNSDQILYVAYGVAATTTAWTVQIEPGGFFSMDPVYTGAVHGIWAANSTGNAQITELT